MKRIYSRGSFVHLFCAVCLTVMATLGFNASSEAMEFNHGGAKQACRDPDSCAFWVEARGEFTEDTDKDFLEYIKSVPQLPYTTIRFSSTGGNMHSAIRLGLILRAKGFITESAFCASACLYAFLGGAERRVLGATPRLGIHRFYREQAMLQPEIKQFSGEDLDLTQRQMAGLLLYLTKMGVDPRLLALSIEAGPNEMRWLDASELKELKVVYEPSQWMPWQAIVPENSRGIIAISETQDRSKSMQIICTNGRLHFTVVDENGDPGWFQQCRSSADGHHMFGVLVPATRVTVRRHPATISFNLPMQGIRFTRPEVFSDRAPDNYPMACQTDSYRGTSVNFKKMAMLAMKNCVD